MPRKNPLAKQEREIGQRIKEIRLAGKCPRSYLAFHTKVGHSVITFMELGRTAVKYDFARRFCSLLNVNPAWLATGRGDLAPNITLPTNEVLGVSENARFSEVFSSKLAVFFEPKSAARVEDKSTKGDGFDFEPRRKGHTDFLFAKLTKKMEEIRSDVLDAYVRDLIKQANEVCQPHWVDQWENTLRRRQKRMSEERERKLRDQISAGKDLTESETAPKHGGDVKAQLPELLERLKKATAQPGKKTALAKFLKAPLASVSRWLSGEREPGGEVTLKLLRWCEFQERQTK